MQFTPKTEEEIKAESLWPAGEYGFEVVEQVTFGENTFFTQDTTSKKGNEMIQLVLKVFNNEGHAITLLDYLLEAMPGKLRHAAEACGLLAKYETGQLTADDFKGKSGNLKLAIQKGKAKDDGTGNYPDKNTVGDYVPSTKRLTNGAGFQVNQGHASMAGGVQDDTIPFMSINVWAL